MKATTLIGSIVGALLLTPATLADSLVDGIYRSAGDANGKGQCTLTIQSLEQVHKYGDQVFELESSGDGACEWSAVGVAKSFEITAGLVSNNGTSAFVRVRFPFGPAGNHVEITTYDVDGSVRNTESFTKLDERLTSG